MSKTKLYKSESFTEDRELITLHSKKIKSLPKDFKQTIKKTYSPTIGKELSKSLMISPDSNIYNCQEDEIFIKESKTECVKWNSPEARNAMLLNIKSTKITPSNIVAPKQLLNNCWFNCFFMVFFISDKGRKFFRYLRELMVKGVKKNGEIMSENIHKAFFFLNRYIDASLIGKKDKIKNFAENMDTNFLIAELGYLLSHKSKEQIVKLKGNPLNIYDQIINYLSDNTTRMEVYKNILPDKNTFNVKYNSKSQNIPHIILITISESKAEMKKPLSLEFNSYRYKLDSIILRDILSTHFACFITLKGKQYAFDGASLGRLNIFDWQERINSKDLLVWDPEVINNLNNFNIFGDEEDYEDDSPTALFSFQEGYQQLFYYRVE